MRACDRVSKLAAVENCLSVTAHLKPDIFILLSLSLQILIVVIVLVVVVAILSDMAHRKTDIVINIINIIIINSSRNCITRHMPPTAHKRPSILAHRKTEIIKIAAAAAAAAGAVMRESARACRRRRAPARPGPTATPK